MNKYYILTFENTHGAISAESVLKEENIKIEIMPTPTNITKSCGISIKLSDEYIENVRSIVNGGKIRIKNIYVKDGLNYNIFEI
ncbi:DUF3343 domain-containing protein [Clostridium thailandense]|uniref:DUF3343 domain-containing protein n=1 Tax=Clostridium thailandense TaxID=2794346 RepID=A0A949U3M7_9CLOT|nr:DUF3343 domain-containing protein [Clostridium thailandense]MBV7275789.1 DUF3343 domain-containing protein [Clostridium thailandense]